SRLNVGCSAATRTDEAHARPIFQKHAAARTSHRPSTIQKGNFQAHLDVNLKPQTPGFAYPAFTTSRKARAAWLNARRAGHTSRILRSTCNSFTLTSHSVFCSRSFSTHIRGRNATP